MSPGTFEAALRAAGGAVFAVDEVMTRKVRNAFERSQRNRLILFLSLTQRA